MAAIDVKNGNQSNTPTVRRPLNIIYGTHNTHSAVMPKSQPRYELDQFKQLLNKFLHSDDSETSVLNMSIT